MATGHIEFMDEALAPTIVRRRFWDSCCKWGWEDIASQKVCTSEFFNCDNGIMSGLHDVSFMCVVAQSTRNDCYACNK